MLVRHCLSLTAQGGNAVLHYGYNYGQLCSILQFLTFCVSPHQQLALRTCKIRPRCNCFLPYLLVGPLLTAWKLMFQINLVNIR